MIFDMFNPPEGFSPPKPARDITVYVPNEKMVVALNKKLVYTQCKRVKILFPKGFRFILKNFYCYMTLGKYTTSLIPVDEISEFAVYLEDDGERPLWGDMFCIYPEDFEVILDNENTKPPNALLINGLKDIER